MSNNSKAVDLIGASKEEAQGEQHGSGKSVDRIAKMFEVHGLRLELRSGMSAKIVSDDFAVFIEDLLSKAQRNGAHAAFALYESLKVSQETFDRTVKVLKNTIPGSRLAVLMSQAKNSIPFAIENSIDLSKVAVDTVYTASATIRDKENGKAKADPAAKEVLALLQGGNASQSKVRELLAKQKAEAADAEAKAEEAKKKAEAERIEADPAAKAKADADKSEAEFRRSLGLAIQSAQTVKTFLVMTATRGIRLEAHELAAFGDMMGEAARVLGYTLAKVAPGKK